MQSYKEKVRYAEIIRNIVKQNNPKLKLSVQGPKDLAVPSPRAGGTFGRPVVVE